MNSNLVYFCLFHNKDYIELLRILMITVKLYSQTDTIDFLVLTEPKFESAINDLSTMLNIPIRMKMCDTLNNVLDSCYARYSIFEYEHIHNYQKILYLDTDIIVQNDLTTLFNIDIEDRIYAIPEGSIQFDAWGGMFFDFTTIDKSTSGINAGILLFKNTEFSRMLFKDITDHITFMKRIGCCMPEMADQPFVNFHCIKSNRQDIILMNKYIYLYCDNPSPPPSSPTDVILCHFIWPIGNALHKKNRMLKHVLHILNNYKNLLKDPKPFVPPNLIGNVYSWGNTIITFVDDSTIQATWATYNYIWLDEFTIEANWSKYSHIIRFNSDYTNYICVRKDNLDYGNGSLVTSELCEIIEFENRNDMLRHYSNTIDKPKILEIGIFKGEFFDFLANNCSVGLLDGVDLFVGTNGSGDQDGNNFIWYNLEQSFNEITEKYKNNPNVNLYKSDSSTYLQSKMDDYYDIIYIDGDHTYEGCKRDLLEAFKKIKHGGYIMGHDYEINMKKAKTNWKCGVTQAVNEFCDTYKQIIIAKAMDGCVGFCIRIDKATPAAIVPLVVSAAVKQSIKHSAPINSINANLVYFCLFDNDNYIDLLRILMITIKLYSQTDTIDFLVLTEAKFESAIKDLSTILTIPIRIKICNALNGMLDSCCIRYSIFEYEHIHNYQKILYLDTDVIVQNDLLTLFNIDIEDRIHGMPELDNKNNYFTIESEWFGGWFFDFNTIDKYTVGMNAGILFFKNTELSRTLFKDITEHITSMKKNGRLMPVPWDQPFLNYHCIKCDRHNTTLLNKYGCIYFRNPLPPPSNPTDKILCHYPGDDIKGKKNRMLKHVLHILNNYKNLLKDPKPFVPPNLIGNVYSWGNTIITFVDDSTIQATWATYNYIWLDEFTLEANWSKYSHIIRFNSDYTNYICVRKDNLDYGNGSLTTSTINIIFLNELLKNQFTMVSIKRLVNLYNKCSLFTNTSHSFVECGVAKGGCLAVMKKLAGPNNKVFGFDSFEGMPPITPEDLGDYNKSNPLSGGGCVGDNLSGGIENVYKTFQTLQLDMTNVHLIKGFFHDTLVQQEIIDKIGPIAVLRLDGDWYESTKVCLEALYDKVIVGGVIIIDDYGHWVGAKRATDEFRQKRNIISPLIQTDYSEHYWIKTNDFENINDMLTYY